MSRRKYRFEDDNFEGTKKLKPSADKIQAARDYLNGGWEEAGHAVPSIAGLARVMKRRKHVLYTWRYNSPEFNEILEEILDEQHVVLLNGGLRKQFESGITKLMLHGHGYSDKQSVDHTSGGKTIKSGMAGFYADDSDGEEES